MQSTHPDSFLSFHLLQYTFLRPPKCCIMHPPLNSLKNWLWLHFTSAENAPLCTYVYCPQSSDTEAYKDALPPKTNQHHWLTTYSDAWLGSQIENATHESSQLPLFKFRGMSGAIIFRSGGPITWKEDCQDCIALSSCEAEIWATNIGSCLTVNVCTMISHLSYLITQLWMQTMWLPCTTITMHAMSGVTTW